jgi:hypothetical protein
MKPISIHVGEGEYQEFRSLAARTGRSVAELIHEAMAEYLGRKRDRRGSIFDVPVHHGGSQLKNWNREEVFDELISK